MHYLVSLLAAAIFFTSCQSTIIDQEIDGIEVLPIETSPLEVESIDEKVEIQNQSPFEETPFLVKSLEGSSHVFALFSEVDGACSAAPSGEICAYAVWNSHTNVLEYSKEPTSWREWVNWGGPLGWQDESSVISFTTFGDTGAYLRTFNVYNFVTEAHSSIWKLYVAGSNDNHRFLALDFGGKTYFLDDSMPNSFTIYEALDDIFTQSGDGIGSSRILYDRLKKLDEISVSGDLLVEDTYDGLFFSFGDEHYSFDFLTNLIVQAK